MRKILFAFVWIFDGFSYCYENEESRYWCFAFTSYINVHYNPSSHTTHIVCVNFYTWVLNRLRKTDFWTAFNGNFTSSRSIYIHNIIGHYNIHQSGLLTQFLTPLKLCVLILYINVDSERQIFWDTFHDIFSLLSEFFPEICWEQIAAVIFFLYFILMSGLGLEPELYV